MVVERPPQTLAEIEPVLWQELGRAAREPGHAWRTPVLATADGERADARVVVLREVDLARRRLLIYTDARSPKVRQIEARPEGVLVLWSAALSWQLRLSVRLAVTRSGLSVSSRWALLKLTPAAQDYLAPLAPGSRVAQPLPERGSRSHFALVTADVLALDWLELGAEGARRAVFDDQGGRWVTP